MAAIHLKLNILTYFLIGYKQVTGKRRTTAQRTKTDKIILRRKK